MCHEHITLLLLINIKDLEHNNFALSSHTWVRNLLSEITSVRRDQGPPHFCLEHLSHLDDHDSEKQFPFPTGAQLQVGVFQYSFLTFTLSLWCQRKQAPESTFQLRLDINYFALSHCFI